MRRQVTTPMLWALGTSVLVLLVVRGGPWLWPRLFPAAVVSVEPAAEEAPSPEYVAEVLSRFLAGWGEHLPPGDVVLEMPPGRRPQELQAGLRGEPRLGGLQVYVTQADELHHELRIFAAERLLLQRRVRSWLPERPVVSAESPPLLGLVVVLTEDETLRRLGAWEAPLGIALPPFAPHAARSARQASWDGKGVLALLDPAEDLVAQSQALREAGGVLLLDPLGEGADRRAWLTTLSSTRQFLLDGRVSPSDGLAADAEAAGVPYQRVVGRLAAGQERRVVWALCLRRGGGVVVVDATDEGLGELEDFVEASRDVGFALALPAEVLSESGGPPAP